MVTYSLPTTEKLFNGYIKGSMKGNDPSVKSISFVSSTEKYYIMNKGSIPNTGCMISGDIAKSYTQEMVYDPTFDSGSENITGFLCILQYRSEQEDGNINILFKAETTIISISTFIDCNSPIFALTDSDSRS